MTGLQVCRVLCWVSGETDVRCSGSECLRSVAAARIPDMVVRERVGSVRSLVGWLVGRCSLLHGERETERLTAWRANVVIDQRATLDSRTTVKRFVE